MRKKDLLDLSNYLTCHDRIEKALLKINQIEQEIFSSKNMLLKKSLNDIRKILLGYGPARECYLDKSLKNNEI